MAGLHHHVDSVIQNSFTAREDPLSLVYLKN